MRFSADIARYAQKVGLEVDDAVVAVCSKLTELVIEKTPVKTSRLRSNWYASIDSYSAETSEIRTEAEAISHGLATAQKSSGHIFTLTNNMPYAYRIEYLGWSHIKAPLGMARISVAEIANSLK